MVENNPPQKNSWVT